MEATEKRLTAEAVIEILGKVGANIYIPYDIKCNIALEILALSAKQSSKDEQKFDENFKGDDDFVKAHEQPANDQRESVGDILLKDDIETISAILSQEGKYEMANDLLRRYNNLIAKYASQKQSVVLPSDEDIEKQSEIEIDPGIIDNFQTGHTPK